jgi:hypothetical protein
MVHVVVPGKILIFDAPSPHMPPGRQWHDVAGKRRFSADFYADLLHDLGVTLVVRADAAEYDAEPFARRGIAVETLDVPFRDGGSACAAGEDLPTLQALDRFIALLDRAGGSLAIHCRGRSGFATTLLAAYLLRRRLFDDPAAAVAWLDIARPGGLRAPVSAADLQRALPPHLASTLLRGTSFDCDTDFAGVGVDAVETSDDAAIARLIAGRDHRGLQDSTAAGPIGRTLSHVVARGLGSGRRAGDSSRAVGTTRWASSPGI